MLAKIDETASRSGGNGTVKKEAKSQTTGQAGKEQEVVSKEPEKKKNETKVEPTKTDKTVQQTITNNESIEIKATPVASAIIADKKLNPSTISPSGINGKILKDDVLEALTNPGKKPGIELFSRE